MKKHYIGAAAVIVILGVFSYYVLVNFNSKELNLTAGALVGPTMRPDGGTFRHGIAVTITPGPGAEGVRYTTDGHDPSCSDGLVYAEPFKLIANATVKAVDCAPGGSSPVVSREFRFVSGSGSGNPSNNPTEVPGGLECDDLHPQLCPPEAPEKASTLPDAPVYGNIIASSQSSLYRSLSLGSQGDDVAFLQEYLIANLAGNAAAKLAAVGTTGYFGMLTRDAVSEFQWQSHITPRDGYAGPLTIGRINASLDLLPQ